MDRKHELLKRVPLFSGLSGAALEEIDRLADEVAVPEGRDLVRQGAFAHEFFLVLDGEVEVERDGRPIATLGAGDFVGEIALVDGGTRTATVRTTRPSRLLVLGHREFNTLMADFPDVRIGVLEALAKRVRRLEPDAT
ncbi:MAG TPA: Crp/Fnr family transcriptional regulator [Candidatus Limnocylindrales bacterium]|nr:Crp/Fnr family transcriptional regulator [Candidatus Limnocylindrales bacterium]